MTNTAKAELPQLPVFHICGAAELLDLPPGGWSHVVSLWNSPTAPERREIISVIRRKFRGARVHGGFFDDIETAERGRVLPTENDIMDLLAFAAGIPGEARVLVHCMAGLGRSTASAFAIACQIVGKGWEREAYEVIRNARPQLAPNRLIVRLADRLLRRDGAMVQMVNAHWQQMAVDFAKQSRTNLYTDSNGPIPAWQSGHNHDSGD